MKIIAIIPARMGSSRFPGKPMALINGMPMIGHVYKNVSKSSSLDKVIVATCDKEIYEYINSIGGTAVMTRDDYERASDRCAEALLHIEEKDKIKYDVVVMVQGDEPMTNEVMIDQALSPFIHDFDNTSVVNLYSLINSNEEFIDRNCIKVVMDQYENAMYFSREPIPTTIREDTNNKYKQVCVIPFKRDYLLEYTSLNPTPLEIIESVDMLRVLEHGQNVKMVLTEEESYAVDTVADLERIKKYF